MRPAIIPVGAWALTVATAINCKARIRTRIFFTALTPTKGLKWKADATHQVLEARVGANRIETRIDLDPGYPDQTLLSGPFEPCKCLVIPAEGHIRECAELVGTTILSGQLQPLFPIARHTRYLEGSPEFG